MASLKAPPASVASDPALRAEYGTSLMVMRASEDKTFRGASIASPTMPWHWGDHSIEKGPSAAYHLVWSRDLYFSATPLAWSHAVFVRLAWSIDAGRPVERPSVVACRYAGVCG